MKKYALLSMVAAALVGCGGAEELPALEGQEEVATLEDAAGEDIAPVIQEDETGRVTASGANCHVDLQWCKSPTTGTYQCTNNGQCTLGQAVTYCISLVNRIC
ncbi:hypothetical protein JY651_13080 [Pyxidicoccus parkwayensis]|uniref:Lipoprotein n=1 Tax=Pyxidicoccus parkwayensis TaxID=2813578 RepID=A0ABX7P5Q3_9BACT|nr:hypothetical protein [Pyxidicoccus parkwaysis]QSQ25799.1 hypothetical protein JY651_13080 [Pyxidicoccus parkwaysis]